MNGRGSEHTPSRTAGFLGAFSILLAILTPACWGAEATLEERLQRLEDRVSRMNLPRISGYIHGQYDAQQKNVSGMRIRRMRLAFTQTIVEKLDAEIEFALPKPDVNQVLEYAFITYRWTERLSSRAGRFKTVFGREEPMPTTKLPYVEKAFLSDVLSHEIDQGIDVTASSPFGDLSVAVVNGQNKNDEANNRKDVVGRLGARPFHRVSWAKGIEFGLSGHHGLRREGAADIGVSRLGVDADWETERIWVRAEWARGDGWNKLAGRDSRSRGAQAFVVWKVRPAWDLLVMHDRFEPDRDAVNEMAFDATRNEVSRTTLGVTWFFSRERRTLVRANYEFNREEEGHSVRNDALRLQFQARF